MVSKTNAEANNPQFPDYNSSKPSTYDANNLYGYATTNLYQ